MQIKFLQRADIDDIQWNARIEESGNGLPYALTDYLDIVTAKNWSALVGENYEAIFPLPFENKLGVTMYLQPPFTQQLGLIAKDYSLKLLLKFLHSIPNTSQFIHLKGNEGADIDTHSEFNIKSRSNFILPLNIDYEIINSAYSKSLKKRVRKSKIYYEVVESRDIDLLVSMYKHEMNSKVDLKDSQYEMARKLFGHLMKTKRGAIYVAKNNGVYDCTLFVIEYQNRIINLFGSSNAQGKKNFAMHCILNHLIEKNSNSNLIFDFEGSDIPGVKKFYESFGPELVTYPEYYLDRLPIWYQGLQKIKSIIS